MDRRHLLTAAATLPLAPLLTACGGGGNSTAEDLNMVQALAAEPDFATLVIAVQTAGLAGALSGPGPFTVFAPGNAAFAAVLGELGLTLQALLGNVPLLTSVLQTHVITARVLAADVPDGRAVSTLGGAVIKPSKPAGGGVQLQDGRNRTMRVTNADLKVSNGVIHRVDRVLLPPNRTVVETAVAAAPEFSTLVAAVQAAGLVSALSQPGPFTVFAPTNAAFGKLLEELRVTAAQLLADVPLLTAVLQAHVVGGRVLRAEVPLNTDIRTLGGAAIRVGSDLVITDGRSRRSAITATDVLASNGVIHVIDTVILPPA